MTIPTHKLASGYDMPVLGLGTGELVGEQCVIAVCTALQLGYNHLDTANAYNNHTDIAQALKGIDRSTIFITSKVPASNAAYDDVLHTCEKNLAELGTDYLDLYLLHSPSAQVPVAETMRAFKTLIEQGSVRSIGVSNFSIQQVQEAIQASEVPICTNQVEFHPLLYQKELLDFCHRNNVVITAYSPIARGKVFENETIKTLARKYRKTPAQVSLRWLLQKGTVVIPQASSEAHLRENIQIFDWQLAPEDEQTIDDIKEHYRHYRLP